MTGGSTEFFPNGPSNFVHLGDVFDDGMTYVPGSAFTMIETDLVHVVANFAIEVVPTEWIRLFESGKTLDFRAKDGSRISEDPHIFFSQLYKRHLEKIFWQQ